MSIDAAAAQRFLADRFEPQMKRVLLTGMSGTGKSTLIAALAARGYPAVDMDEPGWSEHADGDWVWREDRVREFLAQEVGDALVGSGCATNQVAFYPQFDVIVLLSAPAPVLIERLATRTNNPYGKRPDELAEVLGYRETVERGSRRHQLRDVQLRARAPRCLVLGQLQRQRRDMEALHGGRPGLARCQ